VVPVLALGGMSRAAARRLPPRGPVAGWAAIDGLLGRRLTNGTPQKSR
jgi:hypothetical protein